MAARVGRLILVLVATVAFAACTLGAPAPYPSRQVSLIVPFPAGGAADATARALVDASKASFASGIVVENRQGGAGAVGMTEVVQAPTDGYKIGLVGQTTMALLPHTVDGLAYDTPEDYQPIIQVAYAPLVLVTREDAQWQTAEEFIAAAKASPGELTFGSAGAGTPSHILFETLKAEAEIDMTHVPFEGDAPAITAMLGGNVQALIQAPGAIVGHEEAGSMKVLATFEPARNRLFPDAPTMQEVGHDIVFTSNFGVYGPKNLPADVVTYLHDSFKKAVETQSFKDFAQKQNYVVAYQATADMKAQLVKDYEFFKEIAATLGL